MPFYETDDLNTWIFTVFTEVYEHSDDEREDQFQMIQAPGLGLLKEFAERMMQVNMDWHEKELLRAVLNTIDYVALRTELMEWIEQNVCEKCHAFTDGEECEACKEEEDSGGE